MFTLDLSPTYRLAVTLHVRGADGQIVPETFTAEFLRMGPEAFEAYRETIHEQNLSDQDIARHVLRGWDDLRDGAGHPVPFNDQTREALLRGIQGAAVAVARTYLDSVLEEVRKNWLPPVAIGPAAEPVTPTPSGPTTIP